MGSGHCGEKVVEIQVELILKDTIKPSSPTPHHLRNFKLSFLDQIQPPVLMPVVFFYPKGSNRSSSNKVADRIGVLKQSLSEVLTRYYPLSGRVFNNLYVDCSDQGVPFIEAHANCHLSEVYPDPVPCELNKLLPFKLDEVEDLPMGIQVTSFDCGGMALAVGTSHKLADAWSIFQFVGCWAKTAALRGLDEDTLLPKFKMAEFFPAINFSGLQPTTGVIRNTSNISVKRFVFSSSAINSLRNKYANSLSADFSHRPTRAEALSTFIWSRFMATTQPKPTEKIYRVQHAVNLRTRFNPPLSDDYFGNIFRLAVAFPKVNSEGSDECYGLLGQMRESIRQINGDYVAKLRDGHKHLEFLTKRSQQIIRGEVVSFSFTNLCRFPLYEPNFGWGKPIWVGLSKVPFKNLCFFTDTPSGNGIEALVSLEKEDMAKFEVDKELLALASPSPGAHTPQYSFKCVKRFHFSSSL